MKYSTNLLLGLSLLIISKANAQGCSDAGVCTIHSVKTANTATISSPSSTTNELRIGTGFARGELGANIYTVSAEYTHRFQHSFSLTGKLTFNSIQGELGNTSGPGDFYLTAEKIISPSAAWRKTVFAGVKVPLSQADKRIGGISVPMVYQPGLGTTDLLAGISLTRRTLNLSLAWQQPVSNPNKNGFLPSLYPALHSATDYPPTNRFSRSADIVARITNNFAAGKKWLVQPGVLGIYHTGKDSYENSAGQRVEIAGSAGITLNGILYLQYQTGSKSNIAFSAGAPVAVRTARPDGLTRKFVLALEYAFRF